MGKIQLFLFSICVFFTGWFAHEVFSESDSDFLQKPISFFRHQNETPLFLSISQDFKKFQKNNPNLENEIAGFQYNFSSKDLAEPFGKKSEIIPTNPLGKYNVSIEIFQKADEKNILIFQFSIFNKSTQNKVAEFSREYKITLKK